MILMQLICAAETSTDLIGCAVCGGSVASYLYIVRYRYIDDDTCPINGIKCKSMMINLKLMFQNNDAIQ